MVLVSWFIFATKNRTTRHSSFFLISGLWCTTTTHSYYLVPRPPISCTVKSSRLKLRRICREKQRAITPRRIRTVFVVRKFFRLPLRYLPYESKMIAQNMIIPFQRPPEKMLAFTIASLLILLAVLIQIFQIP
jgi:hypothetical protein